MGLFKLYECDIGFKVDGTNYEFKNVGEVPFEDPERNRLTRGSNAKDDVGLTYKDGLKDPKKFTPVIQDMSPELRDLFDSLYDSQTRFEFYCISRRDGSSRIAKNCILSNRPTQLNMNDSAESLDISVEIETFKVEEKHKS